MSTTLNISIPPQDARACRNYFCGAVYYDATPGAKLPHRCPVCQAFTENYRAIVAISDAALRVGLPDPRGVGV